MQAEYFRIGKDSSFLEWVDIIEVNLLYNNILALLWYTHLRRMQ